MMTRTRTREDDIGRNKSSEEDEADRWTRQSRTSARRWTKEGEGAIRSSIRSSTRKGAKHLGKQRLRLWPPAVLSKDPEPIPELVRQLTLRRSAIQSSQELLTTMKNGVVQRRKKRRCRAAEIRGRRGKKGEKRQEGGRCTMNQQRSANDERVAAEHTRPAAAKPARRPARRWRPRAPNPATRKQHRPSG